MSSKDCFERTGKPSSILSSRVHRFVQDMATIPVRFFEKGEIYEISVL
jgi:hypothetical protein